MRKVIYPSFMRVLNCKLLDISPIVIALQSLKAMEEWASKVSKPLIWQCWGSRRGRLSRNPNP